METPRKLETTVRAIIIDKGALLMVKHKPAHTYHALPGGRLEVGETLTAGLIRELHEETGVAAIVGPLLFVNEFIDANHHRIEFFFWIDNAGDFHHADPASATHGFEINAIFFGDPTDTRLNLLPAFLGDHFPLLLQRGRDYPTQLMTS